MANWKKARQRVGITAVEATQVIGLGAGQGDLYDQCNYPQRQNRPEQPDLRRLGNVSCEYNVLVATSIGEEGLDIGDVDLIICYDSNSSPIRMLQCMGRTGRK